MGRVLDEKTIRSVFHVIYWNLNSCHYLTWRVETRIFTYTSWHLRGYVVLNDFFHKVRFEITFGGWQNVGTLTEKYPTRWNIHAWYKYDNQYYSQKLPIPHGGPWVNIPNVVMWTKRWSNSFVIVEHWWCNRTLTLVQTVTQSIYWKRRRRRFWHYWKFCTGE